MIARLERWLRWPLWSWRNLTASLVAALVLFTAVGRLTTGSASRLDRDPGQAAGTAPTRNTAPAATAPATSTGAPQPATPTAPAAQLPATSTDPTAAAAVTPAAPTVGAGSATEGNRITSRSSTAAPGADASSPTGVALDFTKAWTRTTLPKPAWLAGLKPLVTAEYLATLSTVDPARVPATRAFDAGRLLSTSGQQSLVHVATDVGGMTVTLVLRSGQWLVADIEPADQPPGATTPPLTRATGATATPGRG